MTGSLYNIAITLLEVNVNIYWYFLQAHRCVDSLSAFQVMTILPSFEAKKSMQHLKK